VLGAIVRPSGLGTIRSSTPNIRKGSAGGRKLRETSDVERSTIQIVAVDVVARIKTRETEVQEKHPECIVPRDCVPSDQVDVGMPYHFNPIPIFLNCSCQKRQIACPRYFNAREAVVTDGRSNRLESRTTVDNNTGVIVLQSHTTVDADAARSQRRQTVLRVADH
jgi:hypothetical protein